MMAKYTFKQFQAEYPNDAVCLAKLMEINYGGTEIVCPNCKQRTSFHPMTKRRAYACQDCGHHVYPAAGTIFHKGELRTSLPGTPIEESLCKSIHRCHPTSS